MLVVFSIVAILPASSNDGEVFESWDTTEIKVVKLKQTWTIKNFSFCDQKTGEQLKSPTFSTGINDTCKWRLDLYPNGLKEEDAKYVSLFIIPLSCNARVQFRLSIINAKQDEIRVLNGTHHFEMGTGWGYGDYIAQDFLFNEENEVLLHDKLTVVCELNVTVGTEDTSEKIKSKTRQLSYQQNYLVYDLKVLFESQTLTDVVLSAGGQVFPVLKTILAIRSPVFKAMFENEQQRIEITDMEPRVLNEMLRYIYTEESPNLKHLACELLAAAEKYELIGLKLMCEDSLSANLTVENAAEYFILGDTYFAEDLKNQARSFIVAHASHVANSRGLASMIETHPRLAGEVFQALSCLPSSCVDIL